MYVCMCVRVFASDTVNLGLIVGMYIIGHRWTNLIDLDVFNIYRFLRGVQKILPLRYGVWSQNIISMQKCK